MWYFLMYLLGIVLSLLTPEDTIQNTLVVIEPLITVALVATLLVPFAGFSREERWQKWCLQYCALPLFGVYTVNLGRTFSFAGLALLVSIMLVHAAYWMSSLHSRAYRFHQFETGFAEEMPHTARLIARLNGTGNNSTADRVIIALLQGTSLNEWNFPITLSPKQLEQIKKELAEVQNIPA